MIDIVISTFQINSDEFMHSSIQYNEHYDLYVIDDLHATHYTDGDHHHTNR